MKKLMISIMAVMLFLTGCGKSQEKATGKGYRGSTKRK